MAGARVSDTQFISSMKRIPSRFPCASMASWTDAIISLIVYLVTAHSLPSYSWRSIIGNPMADWRVWCVIVYATNPMPISAATCDMIAVLPSPGAPITIMGLCLLRGMP